jgi:hypothetical protein
MGGTRTFITEEDVIRKYREEAPDDFPEFSDEEVIRIFGRVYGAMPWEEVSHAGAVVETSEGS